MLMTFIVAVVLLSSPRVSRSAGDEVYYGNIGRLEQCSDAEDPRVKVHQIYMNYKGDHIYTITFNISLEEDLDRPLDMKFEVRKCASEHGPCEDFVNHTIVDLCTELQVVGSIPHTLFDMAKLPTDCPLRKALYFSTPFTQRRGKGAWKGSYVSDKNQIRIHQELLEVGKYGNYWKFKLFLMKGPDLPIFCLYIEGKVGKMSKVKRKKKGH